LRLDKDESRAFKNSDLEFLSSSNQKSKSQF
jgi:hypothetical protein